MYALYDNKIIITEFYICCNYYTLLYNYFK